MFCVLLGTGVVCFSYIVFHKKSQIELGVCALKNLKMVYSTRNLAFVALLAQSGQVGLVQTGAFLGGKNGIHDDVVSFLGGAEPEFGESMRECAQRTLKKSKILFSTADLTPVAIYSSFRQKKMTSSILYECETWSAPTAVKDCIVWFEKDDLLYNCETTGTTDNTDNTNTTNTDEDNVDDKEDKMFVMERQQKRLLDKYLMRQAFMP